MMSANDVVAIAREEMLRQHPERAPFYRVEDYLWTQMLAHKAGTDLREYYVEGWLQMTARKP